MIRRWLLNWLVETLETEVPSPLKKWSIIVLGSLAGGYMYASSGSWLNAIRWDLFAMFCVWVAAILAEKIGQSIVRALVFVLS